MSVVRHRKNTPPDIDSNSNHSSTDKNDIMATTPRRTTASNSPERKTNTELEMNELVEPLIEQPQNRDLPMGGADRDGVRVARAFDDPYDMYYQGGKLLFCFAGLQASYLTWGYMQELIMTTNFNPTENVPTGRFPSAAFCVFSNRFLAVIVGAIACRIKHGSLFDNNTAPLLSFLPCALSNTLSSWSQYASLKFVAFPVQTVFKSSKIIPVMMMGKFLKGTTYPFGQYIEAFLITVGVAIFSLSSKKAGEGTTTEVVGLLFMTMYICCDSFTSQWQSKKIGRAHV